MRRLIALGLMVVLIACHGASHADAPTTTSARVPPTSAPAGNTPFGGQPLWSPGPQPDNSQMPFNPR